MVDFMDNSWLIDEYLMVNNWLIDGELWLFHAYFVVNDASLLVDWWSVMLMS